MYRQTGRQAVRFRVRGRVRVRDRVRVRVRVRGWVLLFYLVSDVARCTKLRRHF